MAGIAIGGFGPLLVAALLVPLRNDSFVAANVTLVLVAIVVAAAAAGGRATGAIAAVVAAASYDFFFTTPYQSLKIDRFQDVVTAALLLGIGLGVAELVGLVRRARAVADRRDDMLATVAQVAELVAAGADAREVREAAEAELARLLSLRACRFETPPYDEILPVIGSGGGLEGGRRRWVDGELSLPAEGAQLPVYGNGRELGRLVLVPDWNVGVTVADRVAARAFAAQVGAALVALPRAPDEPGMEASGS